MRVRATIYRKSRSSREWERFPPKKNTTTKGWRGRAIVLRTRNKRFWRKVTFYVDARADRRWTLSNNMFLQKSNNIQQIKPTWTNSNYIKSKQVKSNPLSSLSSPIPSLLSLLWCPNLWCPSNRRKKNPVWGLVLVSFVYFDRYQLSDKPRLPPPPLPP